MMLSGDKFLLGEDELVDATKLDEVSAKQLGYLKDTLRVNMLKNQSDGANIEEKEEMIAKT